MSKYQQLYDGDKIVLNPQKTPLCLACCDCGLVHDITFVVAHRQKLAMKLARNNRKTAAYRREKNKRNRRGE